MPLASKPTFLERMCVSGSLLTLTSVVKVSSLSPKTVLSLPGRTTLRVQLSEFGFNCTLPLNTIILNGLTFDTLDARGWFKNSFSV